jgi:hypothetical protein
MVDPNPLILCRVHAGLLSRVKIASPSLVIYFQVVSLWAFCNINDRIQFLLKKKRKKEEDMLHVHILYISFLNEPLDL